ncbi:MAG: apolipoprotein N-acyltransferase [Verrucomicrobia bacterium]|nr:apolipoprotein N-acyltransferase [Verrucomicrobiota bacterium]
MAVAGGLMLAAAFPKLGLAGLAWLAPGTILWAAYGARSPFRTGYAAGLAFSLAAFHWLLFIPVRFYPILGWLALGGYLALFPACWCWLCLRAQGGGPKPAVQTQNLAAGPDGTDAEVCWWQRLGWALFCAAAWVAVEMLQARFLTGFPWNLLGVSQYKILPLIQVASVTGVYGVSWVVAWVSVSLMLAARQLVRCPSRRYAWLSDLILPGLAVLMLYAAGLSLIASFPAPARHLRAALVQPSIPQTMIWNTHESEARFQQVLRLSELALATKPDLLVWPEAATPKLLRYDRDIYEAVTNLVRSHGVWLLLGADDAEPRGPKEADYYNSSFLIDPQGKIAATYRKRRLVIFGEYIPLVRWLPFIKWLTPIDSGFTPGDRVVPFAMPDLGARMATLICFEDIFPHWTREYAAPDTDFLVNLTNDGWFGESAAQWQQAANAVFRAVENGLPLVRCANNGLTCWIDPLGLMHEVYFGDSNDIYGSGFKTAQIPLRSGNQPRPSTFYNRHGDWFGWGCVAVVVAGLTLGWRKRKKSAG